MSYLPENYPDSRETAAFQEALQPEVRAIWEARDSLLAQLNPRTADWGLEYWEEALGIPTAGHLDLELRRREIVAKLQGRGPTTAETIRNVAQTLLGVPVTVTEVFDEYRVELTVPKGFVPGAELSRLRGQLNRIIPAHLDWAWVIPVLARIPVVPRTGPRCGEIVLKPYAPRLPDVPVGMAVWLGCAVSISTLPMAAAHEGG